MRFDEFVSVIEKASDEFGSFGTKIPLSRLIIPQSAEKSNINPKRQFMCAYNMFGAMPEEKIPPMKNGWYL